MEATSLRMRSRSFQVTKFSIERKIEDSSWLFSAKKQFQETLHHRYFPSIVGIKKDVTSSSTVLMHCLLYTKCLDAAD